MRSKYVSNQQCHICGQESYALESKYANKTTSLYVGSAAHSLLVKETGSRSFIPITKRKISVNHPDSKEAPHKKQFGDKQTWKDNKSNLLNSLSPSLILISSRSHFLLFQSRQALRHESRPSLIPAA